MDALRDTRSWRLDPVPPPLRWWEWAGFGVGGLLLAAATYGFIVCALIFAEAVGLG